jgi:hypothetical protein|nr:MAG TPA: hypothetical protein [Caudoviricetes sp.]
MLYFNFKNYDEFKEKFGKRITNNGKEVRSNGILLSYLKSEMSQRHFNNLTSVSSMTNLYTHIIEEALMSGENVVLNINDTMYFFHSPDFRTDDRFGLCEDMDAKSIRYYRQDNGKAYKMKAGRFMRHILLSCERTKYVCEQALNYVCEVFQTEWEAYVNTKSDEYELIVDSDFEYIYDSFQQKGNFNSCMNDEDYYSFYSKSVNASAARLENKDGKTVARCIIFNEVHECDSDNVFRFAERQYSSDMDEKLKQLLVNKLIQGGYIDGYKKVGADCHSSRVFVLNDGTSLENRSFYIDCCIEGDDAVSYQDSFKYYNSSKKIAFNNDSFNYDFELDITNGYLGVYDSYHDSYCLETRTVYVWIYSRSYYDEMTCDENRLDDFDYCEKEGDYYDNTEYSDYSGIYIPKGKERYSYALSGYLHEDDAFYSELMDDYIPDDEVEKYEDEWMEEHWSYDEVNEEYVKEAVKCFIWNAFNHDYDEKNVSVNYAHDNFIEYEGEYYDEVNEDGVPYHLVEELEEATL